MILFLVYSLMLGAGLAMDAFSVSVANGLADPHMGRRRQLLISGTFAFFQFVMPLTGWFLVHTLLHFFAALEKWIPWIALLLLLYIGGKMLLEGLQPGKEDTAYEAVTLSTLLLQGVATSIDALSAGFAFAEETFWNVLLACVVIAAVTWLLCIGGLRIGKYFGTKISGKAQILGGIVLIAIGIKIFVTGLFF